MAATGFFDKPTVKQEISKTFTAVRGEQFRALTVALFDYFKSAHRVNDAMLSTLLKNFYANYSKLMPTELFRTSQQRVLTLVNINNPRRSEIVEAMANTLRQMAVVKIYENPLEYREVFEDLSAQTPKDFLYQSETVLPARVFATSVAKALGIKLTLYFTEQGKELRAREIYNYTAEGSNNIELVLQVQGNNYFPEVRDKAVFAYVGQFAAPEVSQDENAPLQAGTIAEILEQIENDNNCILRTYQQLRKALLTMVSADELSRARLIDLYIQFLPTNEPASINRVEFFSHVEEWNKKPVGTESFFGSDEDKISPLVDALAGLISLGQINSNDFFNSIETNSAQTNFSTNLR